VPVTDRWRCVAWAVFAALLAFSWQSVTVHANYGGNWTALYCTGALRGVPLSLASERIFQFPGSNGFDGQMYHYIAHDPLFRDSSLTKSVDDPRLRYRRILAPGLAYILAAGRTEWVDPAYYTLILIFLAAGVYWTAACCRTLGYSAAWGLLFVLLPATLVSVDRMVVDVALAALAAGFAYHVHAPSWQLFFILAAAALTRETGFLLLAGYCGALLLERRRKQAALYSLAAVPALVWYVYVQQHTSPEQFRASLAPLSAIWSAVLHPMSYPAGMHWAGLAKICDYLALAGILAAFALALLWNLRRKPDPLSLTVLCFVAMGLILQQTDHWLHVYDYGRVYSPVLLFLGLQSLQRQSYLAGLPMLLMLPRIAMQFGPQILGAIK